MRNPEHDFDAVRDLGCAVDGPGPDARGNVGMYRARQLAGTIRPTTVEQTRRVVELFHASGRGGLHALSTGRNWGLGSREPARDHAVTLDLGGLDRVRDLDLDGGWAVIEPGVTQGMLAQRLAGTSRMLNATAASAHTSVIGNCLDRGMGVRRQRPDDVAGLEVVLPDGQLIHVGWWPRKDRVTPVYAHGLGPSPLGLFSQSDLGVVTAAAIRLLPRPEAQRILRLSFGHAQLAAAVDELRRWVAQGLVRGVLKVYDLVSAANYGGRVGEFLAHVCVDGTARGVDALASVVREEAAASGLFTSVTASDDTKDDEKDVVTRMLEGAHRGDPTGNDAMLEATLGHTAERVDEEGLGWLFFMPMVPFNGAAIAHAPDLLTRIHQDTGVRAGSTVNGLGGDLVDFVVSIKFRREAKETAQAHQALDRAYHLFADAGFIPYRLDVDHADWMDRLASDPEALQFVRRLKQWLDPHGVIAPGRYA